MIHSPGLDGGSAPPTAQRASRRGGTPAPSSPAQIPPPAVAIPCLRRRARAGTPAARRPAASGPAGQTCWPAGSSGPPGAPPHARSPPSAPRSRSRRNNLDPPRMRRPGPHRDHPWPPRQSATRPARRPAARGRPGPPRPQGAAQRASGPGRERGPRARPPPAPPAPSSPRPFRASLTLVGQFYLSGGAGALTRRSACPPSRPRRPRRGP